MRTDSNVRRPRRRRGPIVADHILRSPGTSRGGSGPHGLRETSRSHYFASPVARASLSPPRRRLSPLFVLFRSLLPLSPLLSFEKARRADDHGISHLRGNAKVALNRRERPLVQGDSRAREGGRAGDPTAGRATRSTNDGVGRRARRRFRSCAAQQRSSSKSAAGTCSPQADALDDRFLHGLNTEVHYFDSQSVGAGFKLLIGKCGTQEATPPIVLYLPDADWRSAGQ